MKGTRNDKHPRCEAIGTSGLAAGLPDVHGDHFPHVVRLVYSCIRLSRASERRPRVRVVRYRRASRCRCGESRRARACDARTPPPARPIGASLVDVLNTSISMSSSLSIESSACSSAAALPLALALAPAFALAVVERAEDEALPAPASTALRCAARRSALVPNAPPAHVRLERRQLLHHRLTVSGSRLCFHDSCTRRSTKTVASYVPMKQAVSHGRTEFALGR